MAAVTQIAETEVAVSSPDDRVVYFPVRHHSPACAWHLQKLIAEMEPSAVLIEGPRDATPLIKWFADARTQMPTAIYTTYARRVKGELPDRFAAYYPFCDYSPELVAIRAGVEAGARVEFIDLTYPAMVEAGEDSKPGTRQNLLQESYMRHSQLLANAAQRAGARDPDDLWDCLYETGFQSKPTAEFIREVVAYCALARGEQSEDSLRADGTLAREAAMAAAIERESDGRVLVVTGGFHTVALPTTKAAMPKPLKLAPDDALTVLIRYSFPQLDRLNGYASGMPSPDFYQRLWTAGGDPSPTIAVELAREVREQNVAVSPADEIACVAQIRNLANLRGHAIPSREDVLDGIRSVFIKGAADVEGVAIMAAARKLLAGDAIGSVPREAGQPPIVDDFRTTAAALRLDLDTIETKEVTLDLYRSRSHRAVSRLMHRLGFLQVPFGEWLRGPDFVGGENLDRIQEAWKYMWTPGSEAALVEAAAYGGTVEDAAIARVLERFKEAENTGQGRSSALGAELVLAACQMGLHRHTADLLGRARALVAADANFISLAVALRQFVILRVAQEPLEAHKLTDLDAIASESYQRACYLIPDLDTIPESDEADALQSLNGLCQSVQSLGDDAARAELRWGALRSLCNSAKASPLVLGGATGLLFAEGQMSEVDLARALRGQLFGGGERATAARFVEGLLATSRSVLWQLPEVLDAINEFLHGLDEATFVQVLPSLRLAFSNLSSRECDRVASSVAKDSGLTPKEILESAPFPPAALREASEIERAVAEVLAADGLSEFFTNV